ncbi:hypothetical protein CALCODRAFT_494878 [Calocera cornea HHB12733]|uniref:PPP4R2-domain-containing protein n=1 Tax=Calocera cornea HHB12733 TaxID=1353952 RepID=A0A165GRX7_9BASI|nr:hypothetical protein CALCODRAFT_494878 [Calocera cornea HHB12733]
MADVDHPAANGDLSQKAADETMIDPAPPVDSAGQASESASPATAVPSSTPVPPAPPPLTESELAILSAIASGDDPATYPPWEETLKPLVLKQLAVNIHRFLTDPPPHPPPRPEIPSTTFGLVFKKFPTRGPPSPKSTTVRLPALLNGEELRREEEKIGEMLEEFDEEAPFTMQRLSELLLYPFREYRMVGKYLRAVERVLSVTSSFDPQMYAPTAPASNQPGPSMAGPNTPSTPFQLASTPLFSPIPWVQGRELPIPTSRRSASPPMSPLDIGPRRNHSPNASPRGSPRIAARRGGPRVATSSAAMSAQTRRRANSQSSPTSPIPPSILGPTPRPAVPSVPEAFPTQMAAPSSTVSQRRSPTPPPKSPPTGPTPTRVDELDNPDAHKTMLDEPVALSSVTTGKVKVHSPELRPAEVPGILAVISSIDEGTDPVPGLGLSLGERFVQATSDVDEEKNSDELKGDDGNGSNGSNGSGEGDEGEVERMVSEEREMEDATDEVASEPLSNWEVVDKPAEAGEDVKMHD